MSQIEVNKINPATGTTLTVGDSGDTIDIPSGVTIANSGTATGFGAIDWQTGSIKTATFAAVAGKGYFCNTTSGEFDATLPGSPSAGDQIGIVDYAGTFDTNGLTVDPNGNKIEGSTDDQHLSAERQAVIIVYVDATQGWIVTEAGDSTTIAPAVITFTTTAGSIGTILDSQRASGYSLSAVTGTVTFGTLTYSISSGSLPTGLSMNSAGAITGTATAVGSDTVSTFTILATASGGVTSSREFTIQVDDPIITYTTGAGSLGTIPDDDRDDPPTYGGNLSAATATASSGTVSYAIQSGSIPAGMSFSTSTAAFSGTADAVGADATSNFTVRATTTSASEYLDRAFSIIIQEPPAEFVAATGPDSAAGVTDGDYKYHIFNATKAGAAGFVISNAGNTDGSNAVEYLVIAGGGAGGGKAGGNGSTSGAGAGGYRNSWNNETSGGSSASETALTSLSVANYTVTVGAGGTGDTGNDEHGNDSVFSTVTSIAGGGGTGTTAAASGKGSAGGNGYGGGSGTAGTTGQGSAGGIGFWGGANGASGGGGGAGGVGAGTTDNDGGDGGAGLASSITGSSVTRAGGGGGGSMNSTPGSAGSGGGGAGSTGASSPGGAGTVNTGGGGGGIGDGTLAAVVGGNGGSGVVIIRYKFQ